MVSTGRGAVQGATGRVALELSRVLLVGCLPVEELSRVLLVGWHWSCPGCYWSGGS